MGGAGSWSAVVLLAFGTGAGVASAQVGGMHAPLLDRMVGDWVLEGTIAGQQTSSDVEIERVLGHYLQIRETSRRTGTAGRPWYESIVLMGWDDGRGQYVCLWLDSTGGEGLSNGVLGYAPPAADSLSFVFRLPDGGVIETTFAYDRAADTWSWAIDTGNPDAALRPFGRVTLSRK